MDARQVLQSTLAPDAAERTNAEQQLAHAAEVDFVCIPYLPIRPGPFCLTVLTPPLLDRLPTLLPSVKNSPTRAAPLTSVSLRVSP